MSSEGLLNKKVSRFDLILASFPMTYMGILKGLVGDDFVTILDVGTGTGGPMEIINSKKKFKATGIDIYMKYLEVCRAKGIYKKLIEQDVRFLKIKDKSYDVVICSHVVEHLTKKEGLALIQKLERIAKKRVVIAVPVGHLHQEAYDDNEHQKHKSQWYPNDLRKMGYIVVGQGLRAIYGEQNMVKNYGRLSYLIFLFSILFQPLLLIKPELGVYMLAKKEIPG